MNVVPPRWVVVLALAAGCGAPGYAIAPVALETHVVVRADALTVDGRQSLATGVSGRGEVAPGKPVAIDLQVPWEPSGTAIAVHLEVALSDVSVDGVSLRCTSTATAPGRSPVRAARELRLADEGAGLFEVFGDGERRVLLTLNAERVERPVVRALATPGDPVRFVVAIEGVAGDRSAVLETNEFRSFVGQSVEYSFQHGPTEGRESIRLVILPVSITGDLITLEVEVSGVLPGRDGPALLSRTDRIVASRRSTTPVGATVGTPPSGYRFQVTPDF